MAEPVVEAARVRRGHWLFIGIVLLLLLLVGVYREDLLAALTAIWQRALAAAGLGRVVAAAQQGIDGGVAKRPLPVVATYAVLYLSICLLLLHLLLPPARWRLAWRLYAGTLLVYVAITLAAKLAGDVQWAYRLGRQLLDFVVSPLPVAGLYVLFRAGFGPAEARG